MRKLCLSLSALLLCAVLGISMVSVGVDAEVEEESRLPDVSTQEEAVEEETPSSAQTGRVLAAENSRLALYADMETGHFSVVNKQTGFIWDSIPADVEQDEITRGPQRLQLQSQVYVNYIYKEDETSRADVSTANSQTECVNNGALTVTSVNNGIRVDYTFENIGMRIPVEYLLHEDYVEARVLLEELDEGDECFLMDLYLLPSFGAGSAEEEGYLFVPDGSGALVDFKEHAIMSGSAELPVYGEERAVEKERQSVVTQTVHMPVFGIVRGDNTLMGVIDEGSGSASLKITYRNGFCGYSAVSPVLKYRAHTSVSLYKSSYNQTMYHVSRLTPSAKTFSVRYYPLQGEQSGYTGMASRYREYLAAEKGLEKRPLAPTFQIELYGMADLSSSFFGINYVKKVKLTTYNQAAEILKALQGEGMDALSLRYVGWTNNGIFNDKLVQKAAPLSKLGGSSDWKRLAEQAGSTGVTLYPDLDLLQFRSGGNGIKTKRDSVRTSFGRLLYQHRYLRSVYAREPGETPYLLLNANRLSAAAQTVLTSYQKLDLPAIGLSTLGDFHYSDLDEETGANRSAFGTAVSDVLKRYRETGLTIGVDAANDYTLPYIDCIWNMPLYSSGYDIYATDVPFYQMVLHGWVTMSTPPVMQSVEPRTAFLKAVETGCAPLYAGMYESSAVLSGSPYDDLYGTTYTLWLKRAAEEYRAIMPLLQQVSDQEIVDHAELRDGVFVTTFANGVRVTVNYTDEEVILEDGSLCAANDFTVG